MTKVIAVIPARGGSKTIKDKNIIDICGKPLIYYQLKNALDSEFIDEVVLATDSDAIAAVGKSLFGERITIVSRPPEISGDLSKTEDCLLYVLDQIDADIVVTLEPTCPLTQVAYINDCIKGILTDECDSCCCGVLDYGFFLDEPEKLLERPMKQDIKPRVRETGNCWATRVSTLQLTENRLGGRVGVVMVFKRDSLHLDDMDDLCMIEAMMRSRDV